MKTVRMERDFNYSPNPSQTVAFKKGMRYERVPEAAVNEIIAAGAGSVVGDEKVAVKESAKDTKESKDRERG